VDHLHPGQIDEFEHPLVGAQPAEAVHFMHAFTRMRYRACLQFFNMFLI
jgi:hypothetical protein